jgi:hypothetical protein
VAFAISGIIAFKDAEKAKKFALEYIDELAQLGDLFK